MFGKAALLVIAGLSSIVVFIGINNDDVATVTERNFTNHYAREMAHQIAVSGANIAASNFFISPAWNPNESLNGIDLIGGTVSVTREVLDKIKGRIRIVSTGTLLGIERRVTVVMQSSSFAKFCLYINDFGTSGFFATGDVFTGPVHVNVPLKNGVPDPNKSLRLQGAPDFQGKVTSDIMWTAMDRSTNPNFEAGFEDQVNVVLPNEFADPLINAVRNGDYDEYGTNIKGFEFTKDRNVSMVLNGDGTATYKEYGLSDAAFNTVSTRCTPPATEALRIAAGWKTVKLDSISPNGAFLIANGNLRLKGVLDGKITIGVVSSSKTDLSARGNVYFEDDVTYLNDPFVGESDDMLGIVAQNYIWAADTPPNKDNLITYGSLFSKNRGVATENVSTLASKKIRCGNWDYRGGVTDGQAQTTGYYGGVGKIYGFSQRFIYDDRLLKDSPPFFPGTGAVQILSWLEE
ncbi:MAG: hypothetical protein WBQ23_13340 [Bacteroidota bacterium]